MFPKSARRKEAAPVDYRNSYGKPRKLTLRSGTIRLKRLRVRDTETQREQDTAAIRAQELGDGEPDPPELYLHGPPKGDFDLALRGLLGEARTDIWIALRERLCEPGSSWPAPRVGATLRWPPSCGYAPTRWGSGAPGFVEQRLDDLLDKPRSGQPRVIDDADVERVCRVDLGDYPEGRDAL